VLSPAKAKDSPVATRPLPHSRRGFACRQLAVIAGLWLGFLPGALSAQGVAIDHNPVRCLVVDKYPRFDACLAPTSEVGRARVYFKPPDTTRWYYVPLKQFTPCFNGVLPKPTKKLVGKQILYYVAAGDRHFVESRTADITANVVASAAECQKEAPPPPDVPNASVTVFPSMPPGFSGGGIGAGTLAAIGGGVAVAAGGAAIAFSGGDGTPPTPPVTQPPGPGTTGPTGPIVDPTDPPGSGPNKPPKIECRVSPDPAEGPSPLAVNFNLCDSTDPDPKDTLRYTFDFGDNTNSRGDCRVSHTYSYPPGPATAVARACVTDGVSGHNSCCEVPVKVRNSCATDNRPPTVSLELPGGSTITTDNAVLNARASDNVGVTAVEFIARPAGGSDIVIGVDRDAPYSVQWRRPACGSYRLVARAHDACGNAADDTISEVLVNPPRCDPCAGDKKPPSVEVTSPAAGSSYGCFDTLPFRATASDPAGIADVAYFLDGRNMGTSSAAPSFPVDLQIACEACYTPEGGPVVARATDRCGNTADSAPVSRVTACCICFAAAGREPAQLVSQLDIADATGQVVLNGGIAFSAKGHSVATIASAAEHRVEAVLVGAAGKPGNWRFEFTGEGTTGRFLVEAGDVVQTAGRVIVFRLAGKPGERVAFRFSTNP
jgi:hypothetical protein